MTGMGHNHDAPFTVEQATILTLLQNRGIWPPNFLSKAQKIAWLEQNRWRVERREK